MIREVTFCQTDGKVRGTQKRALRWDEVVPGSMADYFYRRVCLPPPAGKWALITFRACRFETSSKRIGFDNASRKAGLCDS